MNLKFKLSSLSIFLVFLLISCVSNQTSANPSIAESYGLKMNDFSSLGEYQLVTINKRLPYTGEGSIPELKLVLDSYEISYELKDNSYVTNHIYLFSSGQDVTNYFEALKKNAAFLAKITETKNFGEDGFSYSTKGSNNLFFRKGKIVSNVNTDTNQKPDTWAKLIESRIQ